MSSSVPKGERRYEQYWGESESGVHRVSRPIVVDGLTKPMVRIELRPRIKAVGEELVDDSYRAVEYAAAQFYRSFTLPQLVMAAVALQVHLRKNKEHLQRKRDLQARWTDLARRMKRLRVEDEHLTLDERLHEERRRQAESEDEAVLALLDVEHDELVSRRTAWTKERDGAQAAWTQLEREDAQLLATAPHLEKTEDLRHPYMLTLLAPRPDPERQPRTVASAMHAVVEALQKPLSRTDQILLDIALRRCVRALAPEGDGAGGVAWEKDLLGRAERDFGAEFEWAKPYLSDATRSGVYPPVRG